VSIMQTLADISFVAEQSLQERFESNPVDENVAEAYYTLQFGEWENYTTKKGKARIMRKVINEKGTIDAFWKIWNAKTGGKKVNRSLFSKLGFFYNRSMGLVQFA